MVSQRVLEDLLQELLPGRQIHYFSKNFILRVPEASPESIKGVYNFLRSKGISDARIASCAYLLGRDLPTIQQNYKFLSELGNSTRLDQKKSADVEAYLHLLTVNSLERNYKNLSSLGLSKGSMTLWIKLLGLDLENILMHRQELRRMGLDDQKMITYPYLLGMTPQTLHLNYQRLRRLGLKHSKICSQPYLLCRDPATLEENYVRLRALGLTDTKIGTYAQLLSLNPDSIARKYQHHISLLKEYGGRNVAQELLRRFPFLLGIGAATLEGNVQFLYYLGIDYHNGILLGTTAAIKRRKMAWMLRELLDYKVLSETDRRKAINQLHRFIRSRPQILVSSITTLEAQKRKLRTNIHAQVEDFSQSNIGCETHY